MKTLRKVALLLLLTLSVVCGSVFLAACNDPTTPGGENEETKVTYSVTVTLDEDVEDVTLTSLKAQWWSGTTNAGEKTLDADGKASIELVAGSYTVKLNGLPSTVTYTEAAVTASKLDAAITIKAKSGSEDPETLAAPTDLTVSGNTLSWTAVDNASSYDVYKDDAFVENVTTNSYTIPSDLPAGTYSYAVVAKGDGENYADSAKSGTYDYTVDPVTLDTPIGVKIEGTVLSWTAVDNASGYIVYKNDEEVTTVNVTSYVIPSDLTPGTYTYCVAARGDGTNYLTSEKSATEDYVVGYSYTLEIDTPLENVTIGTAQAPTTFNIPDIDTKGQTEYDFIIEAAEGLTVTLLLGSTPHVLEYANGSYTYSKEYIWFSPVQVYASAQTTAKVTINALVPEEEPNNEFELDVEKTITLNNYQQETYTFNPSVAGTYKITLTGAIAVGDVIVNYGGPIISDETGLEAEFVVKVAGSPINFDITGMKAGGVTFTAKITFVKAAEENNNEVTANVPGMYYNGTVEVPLNLVEGNAYVLELKECNMNLGRNQINVTYNKVEYVYDMMHKVITFVATSDKNIKLSSNVMSDAADAATVTLELGEALGVNGTLDSDIISENNEYMLKVYVAGIKVGKEYTVTLPWANWLSRSIATLNYGSQSSKFVMNNEAGNFEATFTAANDGNFLINYITITCAAFDSSFPALSVGLVGDADNDGPELVKELTVTIDSSKMWDAADFAEMNGIEAGNYTLELVDDAGVFAGGCIGIGINVGGAGGTFNAAGTSISLTLSATSANAKITVNASWSGSITLKFKLYKA